MYKLYIIYGVYLLALPIAYTLKSVYTKDNPKGKNYKKRAAQQ